VGHTCSNFARAEATICPSYWHRHMYVCAQASTQVAAQILRAVIVCEAVLRGCC
jgi:hypothetical protein